MVVSADAPVLAVLTRAPSFGGKSRLFAALERRPNPELLAALLLDTLEGAAVPGVRQVVAVTPGEACGEVREIVGDVEVIQQPEGDLGDRMRGVMATLFARGATCVALIGSDLPHIAPLVVAEALTAAAQDRNALALGPATDGGYYLIAAQRAPSVFSGIEWGSAQVLAQTERAAALDGFHVHRLAPLTDVDTVDDLRRAILSGRASRTAAWVRTHAPHLSRT